MSQMKIINMTHMHAMLKLRVNTHVALRLHLGRSQMANGGLLRPVMSQKSTLVYTLNPGLIHRSIVIDVQIYESHNLLSICIDINNFDIFMLIIDYQADHQI